MLIYHVLCYKKNFTTALVSVWKGGVHVLEAKGDPGSADGSRTSDEIPVVGCGGHGVETTGSSQLLSGQDGSLSHLYDGQ